MTDPTPALTAEQYAALKLFEHTGPRADVFAETARQKMATKEWNWLRRTVLIKISTIQHLLGYGYVITDAGKAALAEYRAQNGATEGTKPAEKSTGAADSAISEPAAAVGPSVTAESAVRANMDDLRNPALFAQSLGRSYRPDTWTLARLKAARARLILDTGDARRSVKQIKDHPAGDLMRDTQLAAVTVIQVGQLLINALNAAIDATPPKEPQE